MAQITRSASCDYDGLTAIRNGESLPQLPGNPHRAGEVLSACAPVYIKTTDGKIYMSNGAAANEAAEIIGFTGKAYVIGEPVTVYREGTVIRYADGTLSPGGKVYLGTAAGTLADAATTGDSQGVGIALDATHIVVTRARY